MGQASTPKQYAKLTLKGMKLNSLIPPASLPADLVPPEPQPAGDPVLDLELEGGSLVVRAKLNGKSVRRALKTIAEHGVDGVNVLVQGNLKPPPAPGQPFGLDSAGLVAIPKTSKPDGGGTPSSGPSSSPSLPS
jgi:hypothetical protein